MQFSSRESKCEASVEYRVPPVCLIRSDSIVFREDQCQLWFSADERHHYLITFLSWEHRTFLRLWGYRRATWLRTVSEVAVEMMEMEEGFGVVTAPKSASISYRNCWQIPAELTEQHARRENPMWNEERGDGTYNRVFSHSQQCWNTTAVFQLYYRHLSSGTYRNLNHCFILPKQTCGMFGLAWVY